jgi:hypothetical protein
MDRKKLVWLGFFAGSTLGGLVPGLWGAGMFSFSSILLSAVGGLVGIYVGFKLGS